MTRASRAASVAFSLIVGLGCTDGRGTGGEPATLEIRRVFPDKSECASCEDIHLAGAETSTDLLVHPGVLVSVPVSARTVRAVEYAFGQRAAQWTATAVMPASSLQSARRLMESLPGSTKLLVVRGNQPLGVIELGSLRGPLVFGRFASQASVEEALGLGRLEALRLSLSSTRVDASLSAIERADEAIEERARRAVVLDRVERALRRGEEAEAARLLRELEAN